MSAVKTKFHTHDGLVVYDLEPSGELWAVAGPDGYEATLLDPDDLPDGFRWVDNDEWESLQPITCPKCGKSETMFNDCSSGTPLCEDCDPPCLSCYDVDDEEPEEEEDEDDA